MEIHRHNAVGTGNLQKIGYQLGCNRLTARSFPVLTRIAVIRHDKVDFPGRCPLARVDAYEHFHQALRYRRAGALNDEDRTSADGFLRRNHDFSIREMLNFDFPETQPEILGNSGCQVRTGSKSEDNRFLDHVSVTSLFPMRLNATTD